MAAITITVSESERQLIDNIPVSVTLSTNVPATIFFTLDGTDPTTSSSIATGPISLPTDPGTVVLKAFATNGTDTSAIITKKFAPRTSDARHYLDKISGLDNLDKRATFPFGSGGAEGDFRYENTGGKIVDAFGVEGFDDGFDGEGNVTREIDRMLNELDILFSETDSLGRKGTGIGTLPGGVTVIIPQIDETDREISSNANSAFFNPKAMVIFQDGSEEPFDPKISQVNKPRFSTENPEKVRDGNFYFTTGDEGNSTPGSALKSHFNPRNNTITYYYFDSRTLRWVISKEPFTRKKPSTFNLSKIVFGRDNGAGKVFEWIPFQHRKLI